MLAPEHVARPSRLQIALGIASDERLTALAAAGNERAVEVIYGRYHQRIYRYCRTLVSDDADAQDALQSTFTAALSSFQTSGPPQAPLRPWLFRIAHNESISILRRAQRRATDPLDDSLAATGDPASELAKRDAFATLVADLRQLPERQRGALVMRELSGLSHEEIGVALGTSTATAKQTIFEARRSLMELAAGRELDCETIRGLISDTDADGRTMRSRRVRGHLSACTACTAFADQLRSRRDTLRACAPVLPAAASAALLHSLLAGAGAGHAGAGAGAGAGTGTIGAGASAGKLALAGLGTKTLASAAVTITAGICIGGVVVTGALDHDHHRTGRHVARLSPAPATGATLGSGAASGAPVGLAAAAGSAPGWTPANTRLDSAPGGGSAGGGHGARGASSGPGQGRGLGAGARPASQGPGATRTGTGSGTPNGAANGTKTRAHGNGNGAANGTKTRAHGNGNGAANGTKTRAHGSGNGASKTPGNGSSKGAKTRSHGTGKSASTPAKTQTGNSHAGGNGATGKGKSGASGSSHGNATSSTQSTRSASGTATAPSTTQGTTTNPGHAKK